MKAAIKEITTGSVLCMGVMFILVTLALPILPGDPVGAWSPWTPIIFFALVAGVWLARRIAYDICDNKLDLSGVARIALPEAMAMVVVFAPLLAFLSGWNGTNWLWLLGTIAVASVALGIAKSRKVESRG